MTYHEMTWNDMKWNEMKLNEIKLNRKINRKWNEMKWNENVSDDIILYNIIWYKSMTYYFIRPVYFGSTVYVRHGLTINLRPL